MEKRAKMCDATDLADDDDTLVSAFVEGLARLLCGISAYLNANVVAAPIGHFIVINDSRFMFSRIFRNVLLLQLENYIDDIQKNISFKIRTSNDKFSKKKVKWPDFWTSDCIWRLEEL